MNLWVGLRRIIYPRWDTVSDSFNPYQAWLGIEPAIERPDLYQLFGLERGEQDRQRIAAAADRAMARVRAQRPGPRAAAWARLLDELDAARHCLLDLGRKREYDEGLARGELPAIEIPPPAEEGSSSAAVIPVVGISAAADPPPRPEPVDEPLDDFEAAVAASLMLPPATPRTAAPSTASVDPMAPFTPVAIPAPQVPVAAPLPRAPLPARRQSNQATLVVIAGTFIALLLVVVGAYSYIKRDDARAPTTVAENAGANNAVPTATASRAGTTSPRPPSRPAPRASIEPRPARELAPIEPAGAITDTDATMLVPGDVEEMGVEPDDAPDPEASAIPSTVPAMPATDEAASPNPPAPAPEMPFPTGPPPTAEELEQLGTALTEARTALSEQRFADADRALAAAKEVVKLPEHQAMVARLEQLGGYARKFAEAVERAIAKLEAGATFELTDGEPVVVVERLPNVIKIRWKGQTLDFALNKLPISIGIPLAEQGLDGSPEAKVVKGAFQALHRRATPEHLDEVRQWWTEALQEGAPIEDLLPVLDDRYEFASAAPE